MGWHSRKWTEQLRSEDMIVSSLLIMKISRRTTLPTACWKTTKGNFWIATNNGLVLLNRKTNVITAAYHVADGLAGEVVYGMLEDKKGNSMAQYEQGSLRI